MSSYTTGGISRNLLWRKSNTLRQVRLRSSSVGRERREGGKEGGGEREIKEGGRQEGREGN